LTICSRNLLCENNIMRRMVVENSIVRRRVVGLNCNSILFLLYYLYLSISRHYISWIFISMSRWLYTREGKNSIASQHGIIYSLVKLQTMSLITYFLYNFIFYQKLKHDITKEWNHAWMISFLTGHEPNYYTKSFMKRRI